MKKLSLYLAFIFSITATAPVFAQEGAYSKTVHYSVDFDWGNWFKNIGLNIYLSAKGLNWDELSFKTTFQKDKDGNEKVIEVIAWPDNTKTENPEESEIVFRLSSNNSNFLNFLKKTNFKSSESPKLLDLYNYLYDSRDQEIKFDSDNLFDDADDAGTMHSRFTKKTNQDETVISIETLNGSGSPNGWAEAVMKLIPGKTLTKISAKIKIGVKITLTEIKKDPEEKD